MDSLDFRIHAFVWFPFPSVWNQEFGASRAVFSHTYTEYMFRYIEKCETKKCKGVQCFFARPLLGFAKCSSNQKHSFLSKTPLNMLQRMKPEIVSLPSTCVEKLLQTKRTRYFRQAPAPGDEMRNAKQESQ